MNSEPPKVDRSPSEKVLKFFLDSGGENSKALRPKKAGYTCTEYDWNKVWWGNCEETWPWR